MSYSPFLDVAFAIGVLAQLVKLTDLIFSRRQQDWFNRLCESTTLHLDYLRPLTWFRVFQIRGVQFGLLAAATALWITAFFLNADYPPRSWTMMTIGILLVGIVSSVGAILYCGGPISRWLYGDRTFKTFVGKFGLFAICGGLLMGGVFRAIPPTIDYLENGALTAHLAGRIVTITSLWAAAVAFMATSSVWFAFLISGLVTIGAQMAFVCLALAFAILRPLAWRVVEYNKGPLAALSLFATVVCGCVDAYLRATHRR